MYAIDRLSERDWSPALITICVWNSPFATADATLAAIERLVANTDKGLVSSVRTIDLSKAFDSVDPDVLLTKLSWYVVSDADWFRSYLSASGSRWCVTEN